MNKSNIIYFFICPIIFIIFLCYFITVSYFYDPLQIFSEKYPNKYIDNTRLAAKRVIDNYEFDCVIIGSSMFFMSNPKEILNKKCINIAFEASAMKERKAILDYLFLKNKNINTIIYTYDGVVNNNGPYGKDFSVLYKDKIKFYEKIKFYLQGHIDYKCFLNLSKNQNCIGKEHNYYEAQREIPTSNYILNKSDFILHKDTFKPIYEELILQNYLINYIANNPKTIFHIVIPPYHTLYYKKHLNYLIGIYKIGIKTLSKYKNVKIYFFGSELFSDNINNYNNDKIHYKKHINTIINKSINEGTNTITIQNMNEILNTFIKKVENYNIQYHREASMLDIEK